MRIIEASNDDNSNNENAIQSLSYFCAGDETTNK